MGTKALSPTGRAGRRRAVRRGARADVLPALVPAEDGAAMAWARGRDRKLRDRAMRAALAQAAPPAAGPAGRIRAARVAQDAERRIDRHLGALRRKRDKDLEAFLLAVEQHLAPKDEESGAGPAPAGTVDVDPDPPPQPVDALTTALHVAPGAPPAAAVARP